MERDLTSIFLFFFCPCVLCPLCMSPLAYSEGYVMQSVLVCEREKERHVPQNKTNDHNRTKVGEGSSFLYILSRIMLRLSATSTDKLDFSFPFSFFSLPRSKNSLHSFSTGILCTSSLQVPLHFPFGQGTGDSVSRAFS